MIRTITLFFSVFIISVNLIAFQSNSVVATINNEPIYSGEVLYAFNKNRDTTLPINVDSLFAYLEQYLNFKLKVLAAKKTGLDTTSKFREEFTTYTSEIRKPYIRGSNLIEDLIREGYENLQYEVRASHILVRIPKNGSPRDTLAAYNQILSLKQKAEAGEDFGELARKNSEDGSASMGGDLGYFTGFSMVYPFEAAAYNTEIGKVSGITRSQFGYHLIKVTDKRPARGRVKTAHIFINTSNRNSIQAQELVQTVYDSLENGGDWRALCSSYSDDPRTKMSGGSLPFYGVGQFPEPLLDAAFALKEPGQFTQPIRSQFGWHIIKLEAKENIKPFNEMRENLITRVQRSGRNQLDKKGILSKLKAENGFEQDTTIINQTILSILDSTIDFPEPISRPLFTIGDKNLLPSDFINRLKQEHSAIENYPKDQIWNDYEDFVYESIVNYEDSLIPTKYPEHEYLINEYREGLLLFEIMESKIWNAAIEDSIGLKEFFEKNIRRYPAEERAIVHTIESSSKEALNRTFAILQQNSPTSNIDAYLSSHLDSATYSLLKIAKSRLEGEDLSIFAQNTWESGSSIANIDKGQIFWVERKIPKGYYELEEITGLAISDYQDELESRWVDQLRRSNKIKVNKREIKALTKN